MNTSKRVLQFRLGIHPDVITQPRLCNDGTPNNGSADWKAPTPGNAETGSTNPKMIDHHHFTHEFGNPLLNDKSFEH